MRTKPIYILLAIFIAALNLRPAITSVAPLLETIQANLGMSGLTASLLTTLPVLCMGVFAAVATTIRDRIGLERTIFIALLLITAATALRGMTSSASLLIITAIIAGIGISLAGPLLSGFIKKYFPDSPSIVSVYSVSMTAGAAIASALSIPIYTSSNHNLPFTLACWAVLGVLAMIVWGTLIGRKDTGQRQMKTRLPIHNTRALLLTLFFGLMASMFYTMTAWISPIAQNLGYSKSSAALLLTVFTLVQIPVSMILPAIVARFGRRTIFLVMCSVFELAGIIMLMLHLPMMPAVICLGIGAGGLFPLALMLPIVETRTAEDAGSWSAMTQCGGYIIGAMGPLATGLLYDRFDSFLPAFVMMLFIVILMIGVQLRIGMGKRAS
ncbi:MFS transporter [Paenibacillaceae bacterium]|nr:MFS transporter [Paenibacillaceae bacterium]